MFIFLLITITVFRLNLVFYLTGADGTKDYEIMVPLKNLSNFWRTLEMPQYVFCIKKPSFSLSPNF